MANRGASQGPIDDASGGTKWMILVDGGSGIQKVGAQKQGRYQYLETLLPQWISIDAVSHAFEVCFNPILATLAATKAAFSFGTQD